MVDANEALVVVSGQTQQRELKRLCESFREKRCVDGFRLSIRFRLKIYAFKSLVAKSVLVVSVTFPFRSLSKAIDRFLRDLHRSCFKTLA